MKRLSSFFFGISLSLVTYFSVAESDVSQVYLATFTDNQQRLKTKISFHHALLADHQEQLLLELTQHEVSLLSDKGIVLSAANALWQSKQNNSFSSLKNLNNATSSALGLASQTTGIPGFSCYETVEETFAEVDQLIASYPHLTELVDIGDSWQKQHNNAGYDLTVLKIGNKALSNPPILFIQSAMHAREYATAGLTLAFAKMLLENPENNPDIDWILQRHQVHILFQTNPDGRKIAETGKYQRKNTNENHCPSSTVGIDLNRNFSYRWNTVLGGSSGDSCSETFRGESPASEPEIAALESYIRSIYPDVRGNNETDAAPTDTQGLYLDIHSYGQLILWPFGHSAQLAPNHIGLEALGKKVAFFNGYYPEQAIGLYPTDGTSDTLAYDELGVAHLTFELGSDFFQSCSEYNAKIKPDNLKALLYSAKVVQAPYLLTLGPDINELAIANVDRMSLIIEGTASDMNFNDPQNSQATHNIATVRYSIDAFPTDENTQEALIINNAEKGKSKQFSIALFDDSAEVVYVQASNETGQFGPVSAINIQAAVPTAQANISCLGARCQFTSTNTHSQFSYLWQLADGQTAHGEQVEFILPQAGEFTVSHRVTNTAFSNHIVEREFTFTVSELLKPTANFTSQCDFVTCEFDATLSADTDSDTLSYAWDFGDATTSQDKVVSHSYATGGNYSVTLTVTDAHQQQVSVTETLQVTMERTPIDSTENSSSGGSFFWLLFLSSGALLFRVKRC